MTIDSDNEQHSPSEESTTPGELLRLRRAVEASGEVIFMTDSAGTITYVNPEFVRVYGYTPDEIVGHRTPRILKSGATSSEEYESFWMELLERQVVRREFVNRKKDGSLVEIESSANPIVIDDRLMGFLAVQRDITDRKVTEAALRDSERRYRVLADAAHDSIFIVNRDAEIEYANAASIEQFGAKRENTIGKRLGDVFSPGVAEEMWREVFTVFTTGTRQYFEAEFETPGGTIWLGTWLVPMEGDVADVNAVMGVARDITDRKRLEREFTQAQKMEAVGRLAGGIAHDFNNLLTAIVGYSDLLLEGPGADSQMLADLGEIKKAGERASRLTRQLLMFSRKETFSPQILDINAVLAELHKMLGRIIGEDIHVDLVMDPALGAVKADPGQIEQVILNLAVNARDAMPQGGSLRIATAIAQVGGEFAHRPEGPVAGRYVSVSIQDSGCGMTADVLAHVFEPFFTTKPAGKGTGLGLATVYGVVKQSGGHITIDSEPGLGTTVTVYFPEASELPDLDTAVASKVDVSGTETILLVEDEPGLRRLMQRTLEGYGYTVLTARSIGHALEIAERHEHPIELLLSDVIMPEMNGPELAQRVIRLRKAIRVLYVSGFTNQAALDRAELSSRIGFLGKPFTPAVLATKVRESLDAQFPRSGRKRV